MDYYKEYLIKNKKSFSDIGEFCVKDPDFCKKNKNLVCELILISKGFPNRKIRNIDYCKVYNELNETFGKNFTFDISLIKDIYRYRLNYTINYISQLGIMEQGFGNNILKHISNINLAELSTIKQPLSFISSISKKHM
jgi:hypothetical protein